MKVWSFFRRGVPFFIIGHGLAFPLKGDYGMAEWAIPAVMVAILAIVEIGVRNLWLAWACGVFSLLAVGQTILILQRPNGNWLEAWRRVLEGHGETMEHFYSRATVWTWRILLIVFGLIAYVSVSDAIVRHSAVPVDGPVQFPVAVATSAVPDTEGITAYASIEARLYPGGLPQKLRLMVVLRWTFQKTGVLREAMAFTNKNRRGLAIGPRSTTLPHLRVPN